MAKIPFDIKYRPQIESGEYKLETKDGRQVRVVCWDVKNSYSKVHDDILALVKSKGGTENALFYAQNGYCLSDSSRVGRKDLFIVTPEPELSKFDDCVRRLIDMAHSLGKDHSYNTDKDALFERYSAELLSLAREQFVKDLPRWKKKEDSIGYYCSCGFLVSDGYEISISELRKKLPGFKED